MTPIKWYSETKYVDTDTGELITKIESQKNYYIIYKTKKTRYEQNGKIGIIEHTNECRRKPKQGELEY